MCTGGQVRKGTRPHTSLTCLGFEYGRDEDPAGGGEGGSIPASPIGSIVLSLTQPKKRATVQPQSKSSGAAAAGDLWQTLPPPPVGLALEQFAAAKAIPVEFLRTCGVPEFTYDHKPAMRIPYLGVGGERGPLTLGIERSAGAASASKLP